MSIENRQKSIDSIQESTITFHQEQSVAGVNEFEKLDRMIQKSAEYGVNGSKRETIQNTRQGTDAGMTSREFNSDSRHEDSLCKSNKRSYKGTDEK